MASNSAPGRLEVVREFINSVEIDQGADPLSGPDGLEEWCTRTGVGAGVTGEGFALLRSFREALRLALEANAGDEERQAAWNALAPFAERAVYRMGISQGSPVLRPEGAAEDAVIGQIFAIVYDAMAAGTWGRLKACRKHSCRWAFYDRSKNGSGAWCSMAVCGNRVKAQKRRLSRKNAPKK